MKRISLEEFIECYKPICNDCTPHPGIKGLEALNKTIWDKIDFTRIANYLGRKQIWTLFKYKGQFYIRPEVKLTNALDFILLGYIVTEVPYDRNSISNLEIIV